jgi:hypothetical protein
MIFGLKVFWEITLQLLCKKLNLLLDSSKGYFCQCQCACNLSRAAPNNTTRGEDKMRDQSARKTCPHAS